MGAGGRRRAARASAQRTRNPYKPDQTHEQDSGDKEDIVGREHESLRIHEAVEELVTLTRPHAAGMQGIERLRGHWAARVQMLYELRVVQRCAPIPERRRDGGAEGPGRDAREV